MVKNGLIDVVSALYNHPYSRSGNRLKVLCRFAKWQLLEKHIYRSGVVKKWIGGRKLLVIPGRTCTTGNYYLSLLEWTEMSFLLRYASDNDYFFDVGANVGVYSVLLAPLCRGGIAFEPAPDTFSVLNKELAINNYSNVETRNCAIGAQNSKVSITMGTDTTNHVAMEDEINHNDCVLIDQIKLDDLNEMEQCTILKIDVEGYEKEVLNGANNLLDSPNLNVVIMEVFENKELLSILINKGFHYCTYDSDSGIVTEQRMLTKDDNGIFVKDIEMANMRLERDKI